MYMTKWWMVRAGDNNELIPKWVEHNVASIGWEELGNPKKYDNRESFVQHAHEVYDEERVARRRMWAGQVWRFSNDISSGDRVITYIKEQREYMIGKVVGE